MSMITFIGLAGGVGTTTLALSAARACRLAVLVDLDLAGGDAAYRAGLHPSTSIADVAVLDPDHLDQSHIAALTFPLTEGSGLIASPAHPLLAERLPTAAVERVLDLCAPGGTVVVDAGGQLTAAAVVALARSTTVVLVGRNDDWCVRQVAIHRELLAGSGLMPEIRVASGRSRLGSRRFAARCGDAGMAFDPRVLTSRAGLTLPMRLSAIGGGA